MDGRGREPPQGQVVQGALPPYPQVHGNGGPGGRLVEHGEQTRPALDGAVRGHGHVGVDALGQVVQGGEGPPERSGQQGVVGQVRVLQRPAPEVLVDVDAVPVARAGRPLDAGDVEGDAVHVVGGGQALEDRGLGLGGGTGDRLVGACDGPPVAGRVHDIGDGAHLVAVGIGAQARHL